MSDQAASNSGAAAPAGSGCFQVERQLQRQLAWMMRAPEMAVGSVDGPVTRKTILLPAETDAVEPVFVQDEPPLEIEQLSEVSAWLRRTVNTVVDPAAFAFQET